MRKKKVRVSLAGEDFYIAFGNEKVKVCYGELKTLISDVAVLLSKWDKDVNNEFEENVQMTDLDVDVNAKKIEALAFAQARGVKVAEVMCKEFFGFELSKYEGLENVIKMASVTAFFEGWHSACDNLELIKKAYNEPEKEEEK
jgi:hypothetical protein